jgi:tetratricopeptide (TPR) repeat protein
MLLIDEGEAKAALTYFRRSLDIYTSSAEAERTTESARRSESVEFEHIGSALLELGDLPEALKNNREALAIRAALVKDFPLNSDHKRTLEVSYYNQGEILDRMGRTREALESYRNDVAIAEKQLRMDSSNEQSRGDLAYGLVRIGDMLYKLGKYSEAVANYRRSEWLRAKDVEKDTANLWKRSSLIEAKAKICKSLAAAHREEDAERPCAETLALMQATRLDPGNAGIRSFFADTYSDLALAQAALASRSSLPVEQRRRRWRQARDYYQQSLEIWNDLENRKILAQADRAKRDVISRELARSEAALSRDADHR